MSEEPTIPTPIASPQAPASSPHDPGIRRFIPRQTILVGALALVIVVAGMFTFFSVNSKKGTLLATATATTTISATATTSTSSTTTPTAATTTTVTATATPSASTGSGARPTARPAPTATTPKATPTPNIPLGVLTFNLSTASITCASATQIGYYPAVIVSNGYGNDLPYSADILYYDHNGNKNPPYSPLVSPASGIIQHMHQLTLKITDPRASGAALQSVSMSSNRAGNIVPFSPANGPVYSVTLRFQVTLPGMAVPTIYLDQVNCF